MRKQLASGIINCPVKGPLGIWKFPILNALLCGGTTLLGSRGKYNGGGGPLSITLRLSYTTTGYGPCQPNTGTTVQLWKDGGSTSYMVGVTDSNGNVVFKNVDDKTSYHFFVDTNSESFQVDGASVCLEWCEDYSVFPPKTFSWQSC